MWFLWASCITDYSCHHIKKCRQPVLFPELPLFFPFGKFDNNSEKMPQNYKFDSITLCFKNKECGGESSKEDWWVMVLAAKPEGLCLVWHHMAQGEN